MWWSLVTLAIAAPPPWTGVWTGSWKEQEFWLALQDAAGRPGLQSLQMEQGGAPALGPQVWVEGSPGWSVLAGSPLFLPRPALLLGLSGPEDAQRWLLLDPPALERGQLLVLWERQLRCASPTRVHLQEGQLSLSCAEGPQKLALPLLPPGGPEVEGWIAAQGEVPHWNTRHAFHQKEELLPRSRWSRLAVETASPWGPALLWDPATAWQARRWSPEPLPAPEAEQRWTLQAGDPLAADPWRALPSPPPLRQDLMRLARPLLRGPARDLLEERVLQLERELERCNAEDPRPGCVSEAAQSTYMLLDSLAPDSWRATQAQASLRSELMIWTRLPPMMRYQPAGADDLFAMHRAQGRDNLLVAERLRRWGAKDLAVMQASLAAYYGLSREDLRFNLLTYLPLAGEVGRWVWAHELLLLAVKEGHITEEQALPLLAEALEQMGQSTPPSMPRRLRQAVSALKAERQRRFGPPARTGHAEDAGQAALAWLQARQELILEVVAHGAQRGSIALPARLTIQLNWSPTGEVETAQVWGAALAPALERALLWSGPGEERAAALPILAPPGSRGAAVELRLEP